MAFEWRQSVTNHVSIQEALDANPGRMIFVPAGNYTITEKIRIRGERAGLFGPRRIVQRNPEQPVIISDFGHGDAHWIWGNDRSPFKFDTGQQPDDPPLADVIVQGNIVRSIGKPRYQYAVIIAGGRNTPRGLHFSNNLFHPGSQGIANKDLSP